MDVRIRIYFEGGVFDPDGKLDIAPSETETHNQQLERVQIEELKTGPDRLFLYVKATDYNTASITTWPGTLVGVADMGPKRKFPCFGPFPSVRRSISVRIFGTLYHGWYYESSGDYCRLKKAKRQ